jgi:hypothetical protein
MNPALLRRLILSAGALVVVSIGAFGAFVALDERNQVVLFNHSGSTTTGAILGASVGMSRATAREQLQRKGLVLRKSFAGGGCLEWKFADAQTVDVFRDDSWRKGAVCVASSGGTVERIVWYFDPSQP